MATVRKQIARSTNAGAGAGGGAGASASLDPGPAHAPPSLATAAPVMPPPAASATSRRRKLGPALPPPEYVAQRAALEALAGGRSEASGGGREHRRAERKRWRSWEKTVEEELVPRETGRDARVAKRRSQAGVIPVVRTVFVRAACSQRRRAPQRAREG